MHYNQHFFFSVVILLKTVAGMVLWVNCVNKLQSMSAMWEMKGFSGKEDHAPFQSK